VKIVAGDQRTAASDIVFIGSKSGGQGNRVAGGDSLKFPRSLAPPLHVVCLGIVLPNAIRTGRLPTRPFPGTHRAGAYNVNIMAEDFSFAAASARAVAVKLFLFHHVCLTGRISRGACGRCTVAASAFGAFDAQIAICVTIMQVRVQKIIVASPDLTPNNDVGWSRNDV
jgi:hypothetical protein